MELTPQIGGMLAGCLVAGAILSYVFTQLAGKSALGKARREAAQHLSDAEREAATITKDAKTTLKEQEIDLRERVEKILGMSTAYPASCSISRPTRSMTWGMCSLTRGSWVGSAQPRLLIWVW